MKLIDKSALVAETERRKQDAMNNCGGFKSMREHECDSCIVEQYEEMKNIIDTIEVKEVDLELITGWFDHIAQIADDRMTLTNQRMTDAHALDEIKCLAKNSSEFITKHYKGQKGEIV